MDAIDLKILYELDRNARIPSSTIAKKVRLSKQAVKVRVDKLISSKVINRFLPFINMGRLGFTPYKIFVSFQNSSEAKRQEILAYLIQRETIGAVTLFDNTYDLYFGIITRTPGDLDAELTAFYNRFAQNVRERKIIAMIDTMVLPRDYLLGKQRELIPRKKVFHTQIEPVGEGELKELDKAILGILTFHPTLPYTDVAAKTGSSVQTVLNRMKHLEKNGVLNGFGMLLNESIFVNYLLLIQLNTHSTQVIATLMAFVYSNPHIVLVVKTVGDWDYELGLEARELHQCRKVIDEFKLTFSPYVRSVVPLLVNKVVKMSNVPQKEQ